MDHDEIPADVQRTMHTFVEWMQREPKIRQSVLALARWLLEELDRDDEVKAPAATMARDQSVQQQREVQLTLGTEPTNLVVADDPGLTSQTQHRTERPTEYVTIPHLREPAPVPEERDALSLIRQRSTLKAEAARWAIRRRRLQCEGAHVSVDLGPRDRELVDKARSLSNCYLWMLNPYQHVPDDESLENIAACYENLAACVAIAEEHDQSDSATFTALLYLFAEAQSALRQALSTASSQTDRDQFQAFRWLREQTLDSHVYVDRYMRLDDPADPTQHADFAMRLAAFREQLGEKTARHQMRQQLLNKVKYHVTRLDDSSPEGLHHWKTIDDALSEWVRSGYQITDSTLNELLSNVDQFMPETFEPSAEAERVLSAAHLRDGADNDGEIEEDSSAAAELPEQLAEARQLLEGKTIALVGGDVRPLAKDKLQRDLGLRELRWVPTSPHEPLSKLRSAIDHPDIALVLIMIRLTSHSHGELANVCKDLNKPFVRLPAGYNSAQVAQQVLAQASQQLRTAD